MSATRIVEAPWARATEAAAPCRNPRRSISSPDCISARDAIMEFMRWRLYFLSFVAAAQGPIHFENRAAKSGVKFVLENSPTPRKHLVETIPGGLAVFDYNADGRPDIFFTNGAALPSLEKTAEKFHNRLFRNDGNWKFTDVTGPAGLAGAGYSIGAAAADFDN